MHTHLASASAWAAADCAGSAWQKAYLLLLRPYTTASTALPPGSIGMLPTYYLGDDLRSGHLIPLLPEYAPEALGIHAIYL